MLFYCAHKRDICSFCFYKIKFILKIKRFIILYQYKYIEYLVIQSGILVTKFVIYSTVFLAYSTRLFQLLKPFFELLYPIKQTDLVHPSVTLRTPLSAGLLRAGGLRAGGHGEGRDCT